MKITLADNLQLPTEIAGRRTAVFGISGSGKSNTATVIVEGLLAAGEQVVLIDPKGEGWGLLSLASGKPSAFDIIVFGEPNGHIETLAESHGPHLADFVVETGKSVVLSLLGFESDQSERRFVAAFLRQLYRRKSRQGHPTRLLVVLEEAHLFVPESSGRGFKGEAADLAGAVQRIVRQGRSHGIGCLIVDQRPQDVAKRVITQCDTLICHALTHNTDRKALNDWVRGYDRDGRGDVFLEALASLAPGEAWIWSPAWLKLFQGPVHVRRRVTFDSGAAPDGSAAARKVQRAEVDLDQLRGQLADVVEQAQANDPKELRKKLAATEAELKTLRAAPPATKETRVEVPSLKAEDFRRVEKWSTEMTRISAEIKTLVDHFEQLCRKVNQPSNPSGARPIAVKNREFVARPVAAARTAPAPRPRQESPEGELKPMMRKMLTALAQHPRGLTKAQVLLYAGYSSNGSTSDTFADMNRFAWVHNSGGLLTLTADGVQALGSFDPLPTGIDLREKLLRESDRMERAFLEALFEAWPNPIRKGEILERSGYSSNGSTSDEFARLVRIGYAKKAGAGLLIAAPELFES